MKRVRKLKLIFILLMILNVAIAHATQKVEVITEGHDDRFKVEAGNVFEGVDSLRIKDQNLNTLIALRFQDLDIQGDWLINNATLSLKTTGSYFFDPDARVTIYGIDVDDCEDFDYSDPFELPVTSALVDWNISDWTASNTWHNVTVTPILQELVNRYGFTDDSSVGFMIYSVAGSQRIAQAYEWNPNGAAKLYIRYNEAPPLPPGLPDGAEYNQTVEGYDIYWVPGYGQVTSFYDSTFYWDSSQEVYPYQEKTAYSNVTDRFYIFGGQDNVRRRTIQYISKTRIGSNWNVNVTLETYISDEAGGLYSDFHLWNDGPNDYLDVAWIDTYPENNRVYYCRYLLNADGSATNLTEPQIIHFDETEDPVPPLTIMVDTEGYPYVAYGWTIGGDPETGRVSWSTTNNGTFTHHGNSPVSVESICGYNPANGAVYTIELARGGSRRMFLIFLAPQPYPSTRSDGGIARNINSGVWQSEGDHTGGADSRNQNARWGLSASSICDPSDSFNATLISPDQWIKELYHRPINVWVKLNDTWDDTKTVVMGATTDGFYYTIGHNSNTMISVYRIRQGSWTGIQDLRDFEEYGATNNIGLWKFTARQYPTKDNKTIVSYAWHETVEYIFWHDWFYLEDGPDENMTDPYWIGVNNETIECETLDCLIDIITGENGDPEDPDAGTWDDTALSRNRTKLLILIVGFTLLVGTPIFGIVTRPEAATWVIIMFAMFCGLALLWSIPAM